MTGWRREVAAAVLLCLLGSLLVVVAAGRGWVQLAVPGDALRPASALAVPGSDLAPGARALGLVGLAGVVAVAATRGRGRVVVGGLLAATGAWVVVEVARVVADRADLALATDRAREAGAGLPAATTAWPLLCLAGGLLLTAGGLLVALRGRRWSAMSARYEPPATGVAPSGAATGGREAQPAPGEASLWDDLDRGVDPTR